MLCCGDLVPRLGAEGELSTLWGMAKQQKVLVKSSRKKRRKQERAAKKARIAQHFSRRRQEEEERLGGYVREGTSQNHLPDDQSRKKSYGEQREATKKRGSGSRGKVHGQQWSSGRVGSRGIHVRAPGSAPTALERRAALMAANQREDRVISRLEKLLKMRRRKNKKKLPASFQTDGLSCILSNLKVIHLFY